MAFGAIAGGVLGFLGSKKQADAASGGTKAAIGLQRDQFDYAKQLQQALLQQQEPRRIGSQRAMRGLSSMMGLGDPGTFSGGGYKGDPGASAPAYKSAELIGLQDQLSNMNKFQTGGGGGGNIAMGPDGSFRDPKTGQRLSPRDPRVQGRGGQSQGGGGQTINPEWQSLQDEINALEMELGGGSGGGAAGAFGGGSGGGGLGGVATTGTVSFRDPETGEIMQAPSAMVPEGAEIVSEGRVGGSGGGGGFGGIAGAFGGGAASLLGGGGGQNPEAFDPSQFAGKYELPSEQEIADAFKFEGGVSEDSLRSYLTGEGIEDDPGYQFLVNEGIDAIDSSGSARGMQLSGRQLEDLTKFGQGTAHQYRTQQLGNAMGLRNQLLGERMGGFDLRSAYRTRIMDELGSMAGMRPSTAPITNMSNIAMQNAQTTAPYLQDQGLINAAGISGQYGNIAAMLEGVSGLGGGGNPYGNFGLGGQVPPGAGY